MDDLDQENRPKQASFDFHTILTLFLYWLVARPQEHKTWPKFTGQTLVIKAIENRQ